MNAMTTFSVKCAARARKKATLNDGKYISDSEHTTQLQYAVCTEHLPLSEVAKIAAMMRPIVADAGILASFVLSTVISNFISTPKLVLQARPFSLRSAAWIAFNTFTKLDYS